MTAEQNAAPRFSELFSYTDTWHTRHIIYIQRVPSPPSAISTNQAHWKQIIYKHFMEVA